MIDVTIVEGTTICTSSIEETTIDAPWVEETLVYALSIEATIIDAPLIKVISKSRTIKT